MISAGRLGFAISSRLAKVVLGTSWLRCKAEKRASLFTTFLGPWCFCLHVRLKLNGQSPGQTLSGRITSTSAPHCECRALLSRIPATGDTKSIAANEDGSSPPNCPPGTSRLRFRSGALSNRGPLDISAGVDGPRDIVMRTESTPRQRGSIGSRCS